MIDAALVRRLTLFALVLLLTGPLMADPVTLPRTTQFDLDAPNGLRYRIFIGESAPEPGAQPPESGYAVLYVLDGNAMFATALEAARFQQGLVPTLIVGIGYPQDRTTDVQRRYRDFTPPTPDERIWSSTSSPRAKPEQTGGEEAFLDFLETVVKPQIARRYSVDSSRQAIFGHSLAGRFVLHTLFTRPQAFTHYIAASPSIWWDDRSVLAEAGRFIARRRPDDPPIALLMTAAEYEQRPAPGTSAARAEFFAMARMVDNARELAGRLAPLADRGVSAEFIEYKDENHGSVVPFALSRAMRFALKR